MVRDALSNYLTLASGLTDVTRQRARAAAKALVAQGGATVEQVGGLAEEILQTSRANRTALVNLVRYEIEHALGRLGLASADEVAALRQRVANLEQALRDEARPEAPATGPEKAVPTKKAAPAKAARSAGTAKKAAGTAKKAAGTAKKAGPAKKAPAKKARKAAGATGTEV
jgi:polyhydroxyalkanoate synthesis regulator phasin